MSSEHSYTVITSDDILTEYAAGTLPPARHYVVACQSEMSDAVASRIAFQESIASAFMEDERPRALSSHFLGDVLSKITSDSDFPSTPEHVNLSPSTPSTLHELLGGDMDSIQWKKVMPGVALYDVMGDRHYKDERLYLLRVKGGQKMPEHSHTGEEWALILRGSYHVDGQQYKAGDLHIEDDSTVHAPVIDDGEDCICLVMTQGPLKMKGFLPRVVQPLIGI